MKLLMKLQNPQELEVSLNQYWRNFWEEAEQKRYSEFSALAYQTFRKMWRIFFSEKEWRCIKKEDESIETEQKKVNELLATTMKEMQIDERWDFLEEKEFLEIKKNKKVNRL